MYGGLGNYTLGEESFRNPMWILGRKVQVLYPIEISSELPGLFFSHGFGATRWKHYESLITHLVSNGFVVVYSPYPWFGKTVAEKYDIMWNGFLEATIRFSGRLDLSKVGFLGHSFGAGAVPSMAWRGLVEEGWGSEASFLFIMAAWYCHDVDDAKMSNFPNETNLIIQAYNEDTICDHRMGIDIYNNIAIPLPRKSYYNIVDGIYEADHAVPSDRKINDLGQLAVKKPLDALMDFTFGIDDPMAGYNYALGGEGTHFQHTVTKTPEVIPDEPDYLWPWNYIKNPRL